MVVDYAHTPDSLQSAYEAYAPRSAKKASRYNLICVLGNTGGGRDKWKREEMGRIADKYCDYIILTNEDPYDEDPLEIINGVKKGVKKKPCEIIIDRREAIRAALEKAHTFRLASLAQGASNQNKIAVLITGKGTDPYIMEANGKKTPWDDASVAQEELHRIMNRES